ncbi:MAG: efflux RND transporter periplasmic adaptor subunit [Lachnospiraceae bacterium]|nr:efflux RND transporter periplasmic adaptor subunit [Lachnospiraceae bacterium]
MSEKKSNKYGRVIAIILIALVVLVAAVIGIRFIINSQHEVTDSRPIVRVMNPGIRDVDVYTEQVGTVQPAETVNVLPMMAGEILEVHFNAGDEVKEGDLLVVVNADSLSSLEIAVNAAKIQMDTAETSLERTKALFETGAVSQSVLEQTQAAADGAKLSYENAKSQYETTKKYAYITAPISGTVEYKNAEVHNYASQGSPVAVITGSGNASVTFGVSEDSKNSVEIGDSIHVYKSGYDGYGKITEINNMIGQSGLYTVKAELDTADGLTANSRVIVNILKDTEKQVLTIPVRAVYHDGGQSFVYVLKDDDTIEKTVFTPGIDDGEFVVVAEGLSRSDNVVYTWSRELYNGAEVTVDFEER